MPLNASGPISLAGTTAGQSIQIENGGNGTTQISLNDAAVRSLAGVPSGAIIMPTNFYGKSNQFSFTIATNQTNANLRTLAVNAGWNQSSKVVATINSGVVVSSNSTGTPGLTINGSFPGGVDLINGGTITGMGGAGGAGGRWTPGDESPGQTAGQNGFSGGTALSVSVAVTLTNNGTIAGGGGGGGSRWGAQGGGVFNRQYYGGGGGGGGRTGSTNSAGGVGGSSVSPGAAGGSGGAGTFSSAGGGGATVNANPGGAGGNWGSAGGDCFSNNIGITQTGGASGSAIVGNSNITYVATGTRLGPIS